MFLDPRCPEPARRIPPALTGPALPRPWYAGSPRADSADRLYFFCKRVLDIGLSLLLLPLALPLLLLCTIAIKLDSPGPAIFTQMRTGEGGRRIRMYKLRTMVRDAEAQKANVLALNTLSAPDFKIPEDPRVTRLGRFLRRTSLDELPQVFNVLKGDMTFVGPRPTSFDWSTYETWQTARLEAKAGVTGLWQVEGRNDLDFDQRVRLDIAYTRNRSVWLDIQILLRTLPRVLSRRGAH
jgi:lipopolysaccharide/colanic/teichoic acid biosynthesis glycosyltransferase